MNGSDVVVRRGGALGLLVGLLLCAGACLNAPSTPPAPECGPPCAPDTLRCAQDGSQVLERCVFNIDDTGCYGWTTEADCASEQAECVDGATPACMATPCPEPSCTPGDTECGEDGALRTCVEDTADARGCGVWETSACQGEQVCSAGACRTPCARECELGMRDCSEDGALRECMNVANADGQDCPTFVTVEDCAAANGICDDANTPGCVLSTCPREGVRDCGPAGGPRVCVEGEDGLLTWMGEGSCEENQTCIDGVCRCDDECDTLGASRCTEDGGGILTCQEVGGCLREVETAVCQGAEVCIPGQGGAAPVCDCPSVEANDPGPGKGCVLNSPEFTCDGENSTLRCVTSGQCSVWEREDACPGPSSGYACQSSRIIRVCEELKNTNDETCHRPKAETCTGSTTCQPGGVSGFTCR